MLTGPLEAIVLIILVVLVVAVVVLALAVSRRSRAGGTTVADPSTGPTRDVDRVAVPGQATVEESPAGERPPSPMQPEVSADAAEAAAIAERSSRIQVEAEAYHKEMHDKADALISAAEKARSQAEEESRIRRVELREQRGDLERREQRLADREERLDSESRTLDERARQLDELKSELRFSVRVSPTAPWSNSMRWSALRA
jgi:ribonuclease Y